MKHLALLLSLLSAAAPGAGAQSAPARKAAPPTPAKAAVKPKPAASALPSDAEKISEGLWRARDAEGKTWYYKRTPFGIVRYREEGAAEGGAARQSEVRVVKVAEKEIVFEHRTPFGVRTWTRSPGALDQDEKRALEQWQQASRKQ